MSHNQSEKENQAEEVRQEGHQPIDDEKTASSGLTTTIKSRLGVAIFGLCIVVAFVLCLAGMTLGMMDSRTDKSCISIWGNKPNCLGSWFRHIYFDDFGPDGITCKKADSLMQGAQAFSVMCLIGGFLTSCVAGLELMRFAELAVVACIMSSISMVATLVVWATMLAFYWSNLCGQVVYADTYKIGNGMILFISAWCLQMVGTFTLMVDIYLGNSK